jgi:hypothetical protein
MTLPFNVTLIKPDHYLHSWALKEAAEYVCHMLRKTGHPAELSVNLMTPSAHNVVFCAHLLGERHIDAIPQNSIVFNSEQLIDREGWHFKGGAYRETLKRHRIWDYSQANLSELPHARKTCVPFLYCEEMVRTDLQRSKGPELLFYGALTEHRQKIIESLRAAGIPVNVLFGVYGDDRDRAMFASAAVLNLHKGTAVDQFEPIRCFYPIANGIPVISEDVESDSGTAAPFRECLSFVKTDSFVDEACGLLRDRAAFDALAETQIARFRETSAVDAFRMAVDAYLDGQQD